MGYSKIDLSGKIVDKIMNNPISGEREVIHTFVVDNQAVALLLFG
jgi:hypothetical protein